MKPILFDKNFMPKCVNQASGVDNVLTSANNFYEGVSNAEVDAFYKKFPASENAPSWGLNSKTMKENTTKFFTVKQNLPLLRLLLECRDTFKSLYT